MGVEPLEITAHDGTRLVGNTWTPEGEVRAAVVIIHGLKDHGQRYAYLAERLTGREFAVYAFDLRGHGRSGGDRAWVARFSESLSDLRQVVELVGGGSPHGPVFLLGHSMGGAIAALYGLHDPEGITGVALSAPALRVPPDVSGVKIGLTKFLGTLAPHAAVFRLPNSDFSRDPAVVRAMETDPLISQRPAPARTATELIRTMEQVRRRAGAFRLPLLLLHGTADRLANPAGSHDLAKAAGSTDKTLKLYPGLYHDLLHEPEREAVIEDLGGWLEFRAPLSI